MKYREQILEEFQKVPENTLIMTGKLYRDKFAEKMGEAAFSQAICRLCKSNEIERISKGIYCRPKKTRFGVVLPSDKEIVDWFTNQGNGIIVGYDLYNSLGITTQVSKRVTAYSALADEQLKQIRNVTVHRHKLKYTNEVKTIICMMELLQHYDEIQDLNYSAFLKNMESLSKRYSEKAFALVRKEIAYPKRTIAFLKKVLDFYHVSNSLSRYLSSLSDYRVPEMEELYETAQQSG